MDKNDPKLTAVGKKLKKTFFEVFFKKLLICGKLTFVLHLLESAYLARGINIEAL